MWRYSEIWENKAIDNNTTDKLKVEEEEKVELVLRDKNSSRRGAATTKIILGSDIGCVNEMRNSCRGGEENISSMQMRRERRKTCVQVGHLGPVSPLSFSFSHCLPLCTWHWHPCSLRLQ